MRIALIFCVAVVAAACTKPEPGSTQEQRLVNQQEYAAQIRKLQNGMSAAEVQDVLGEPIYYEADEERNMACALYRDQAADGRALIHEIRYHNDTLIDQLVGLDFGLVACNPHAAQ